MQVTKDLLDMKTAITSDFNEIKDVLTKAISN
jgi:hypothetical protein